MQNKDYTSKIISRLPFWFAMKKKSSESIGKSFLKVIGLELEELFSTLDYMYEQISINMIDTEMISGCYKAILPETISLPLSFVEGDGYTVHEIKNLRDFYNYKSNIHLYESLKDIDAYFLDAQRRILYSRKDYLILEVTDTQNKKTQISLQKHKVWNYFDEFGLLLNVPRLEDEENLPYLERLKDVFKNPSSSSEQGFLNGLARELGCRVNKIIADRAKDFVLREPFININTVRIDGELVPKERIVRNTEGEIVLLGEGSGAAEVSYVHSIATHSFTDYTESEDIKFENELFYSNGKATPLLKEYARTINEACPIMWNYARWDESYWIGDTNVFGYVPNLHDASIEGFRDKSEAIIGEFVAGKSTVV